MDAGMVVEVGRVHGDFVGADPAGRYVALRYEGVLTVYDVHDALTSVASWQMDRVDRLAVHPNGRAIVVLAGDRTLELWQAGIEEPIRSSTEIAGSPSYGLGWLQYSADGSYLYFGETVRDEPARLNLLDPATLARLDSISPVGVHVWDEPVEDWGEDLESCCAPSPSTAVGFAANAGDDLIVLGVASAVEGGLKLCSGRSPKSWADIPGERSMGMAFLAEDELAMLDSDECVSRIRWKDQPMAVTALARGSDLLSFDADTESAAALRALIDDDADERLMLIGPMFAQGHLLAMAVDRERWVSGRTDLETVALVVVDIGSGERLGVLRLAEAADTYLSNGTICQRVGSRIHVSRWVAPEGGSLKS